MSGRPARPTRGPDSVVTARGLIIGVRWGSLAVAVATLALTRQTDGASIAVGVVLGCVATLRTFFPVRLRRGSSADAAAVAAELAISLFGVLATGCWGSPFVFTLTGAGVALGYGYGLGWAAAAALAMVASITSVFFFRVPGATGATAVLGSCQLVLVLLLAGYARQVFNLEERKATAALSRVARLTEANDLLFDLYRVAQTLPESLDLGDTLAATVARLRELFRPDVLAILLPDEATGAWSAAVAEGTRVAAIMRGDELPTMLRTAVGVEGSVVASSLQSDQGLSFLSGSGVYAPLRARGTTVGLLAVEKRGHDAFGPRDAQLLEGVAEQAALAIDNARWFQRLRTVGADEERTRIARDLHDRVGQALAYLGFELDRVTNKVEDPVVRAELETLRTDVRHAVGEVRETLYDLRTDVSDTDDVATALGSFLERVGTRSRLDVRFRHEASARLPRTHEREVLRIAQEAVTNVERHASAKILSVTWWADAAGATLEVIDDGKGFSLGAGRIDSYGTRGMRERANAIGAALEIQSAPGKGTTVRCRLVQPEHRPD